jgi:type II secretory pathway component PulK
MVGAAVLAAALALAGRNGVNAARNRVEADRAWWRAQDCFARARAAIDDVLEQHADPAANAMAWRYLGQFATRDLETPADCSVRIEAAGTRLDINGADSVQLVTLFRAVGQAAAAEALAAALLDWRDPDDSTRGSGAERDWYAANGRLLPRNGAVADVRELARVRGFEDVGGLDEVLDVEPGRIAINSAGAAVLSAVPGFTDEAVARVLDARTARTPVGDVLVFASMLSPASEDAIIAHYPEIVRKATVDPDAWILTATSQAGLPRIMVTIEARLLRTDTRAVLVSERTW